MTAVVQRVRSCTLDADGKPYSAIQKGLLILLGVEENDTEKDADVLCDKCAGLRIFTDENGKMNLSMTDVGAGAMVVSNFTLCADCSHGRRPSFVHAARPEQAEPLYERFCARLKNTVPVQTGVFGADMRICPELDGPITLVIRSEELI